MARPVVRVAPGEVRYVTAEGHAALLEQLRELEASPPTASAVTEADRRAAQAEADARIAGVKAILGAVTVAPPLPERIDKVVFGGWVTTEDEDGAVSVWRIVGPDESAPSLRRLSVESPVARALLGKSVGDSVTIRRPGGEREVTVVALSSKAPTEH